jgi:regulator of chromosome condensation
VYVVGQGDCGQLGLGEDVTEKLRPGPVHLPDGEKVRSCACVSTHDVLHSSAVDCCKLELVNASQASLVCAGGMHTVCLAASGTVYSWGVNDEGALGRYTEGEAWKKSGLAKGSPGDAYKPGKVKLPPECGKIVALSAGDSHTMILDDKGAVHGWGTFRDSGGVMGFKPGQRLSVCKLTLHISLRGRFNGLEITADCFGAPRLVCHHGDLIPISL